ncbi:hypothetical protein M8818_006642 [Zalaria obscura]|uniref:Uncharacterized protein n=1 Tax=Zalaria obscura TaxID=2024903 RepID=A0ACC3S6E7_9PEZI
MTSRRHSELADRWPLELLNGEAGRLIEPRLRLNAKKTRLPRSPSPLHSLRLVTILVERAQVTLQSGRVGDRDGSAMTLSPTGSAESAHWPGSLSSGSTLPNRAS